MKNTRLLLLTAPLFLGSVVSASAAPRKAPPPVKTAPVPPAHSLMPGGPFRDVPPDHWAAQAVETLRQKGIVRGYPAGPNRARAAARRTQ